MNSFDPEKTSSFAMCFDFNAQKTGMLYQKQYLTVDFNGMKTHLFTENFIITKIAK